MPVLTILDTVAIQNYVFGSNRLKESVGASELIKRATTDFVKEILDEQCGEAHNLAQVDPHGHITFKERLRLENDNLRAELVYAGGGNTVLLFAELDPAKDFARALSKKLISEAPGIEVAIIHHEFGWSEPLGGYKSGVMFEAFKQLEQVKRGQSLHRPLAGLGVTAVCDSTGQVATAVDTVSGNLVSAETQAKLAAVSIANRILGKGPDGTGYEFPFEFDEMGRSKGESSYIAVIHIDGNGMGKKVEAIGKDHPEPKQNRDYIDAVREFSKSVQQASHKALDHLQGELIASIRPDDKGNKTIMGVVPVIDDKPPFRPLIVGGDDLTFVCDGRLALTLSAFYLQQFELEMNQTGNSYLANSHACAGIAVVKSHYPFARAYQLAEDLCKHAKKWVKESGDETDFSALDWHFAPSGLMGDLKTIREREYRLNEKSNGSQTTLLMRPIALTDAYGDWRHWPNFSKLTVAFKDKWSQGKNKIKLLREALRQGPEGYKRFVIAYDKPNKDTKLPIFKTDHTFAFDDGFIDEPQTKRCIHFDAIEAMDFFVPLYSQQGEQNK